ncbi:DUF4097 family beta strand repeat protein [Patescibacteria group bacterium]|nr:DUF4097 family beta strand repeat protein [Patescibacteria group bacterium]
MKMPTNRRVRKYLYKLSKSLKHLPATERHEIVEEIQSHIEESWQNESDGKFDNESLDRVFDKLGTSDELARHYSEQRGFAPPAKKHTVRNVLLIISGLILFFGLLTGYLIYRISVPVINAITKEGNLVTIDKKGISALGGSIRINDSGIRIGSLIDLKNLPEIDKNKYHEKVKVENVIKINNSTDNIEISNPVGDIVIRGTDRDDVQMTAIKYISKETNRDINELLKETEVVQKIDGKNLKIDVKYPESFIKNKISYWVDITMELPKKFSANAGSVSGNIEISDIKGPVNADCVSGEINIRDIEDDIDIGLVSGGSKIKNIIGDAKINAVSSEIEINNVKGKIEAENISGDLIIDDVSGDVDIESTSGDIKLSKLRGNIEIDSSSGDVNLTLANDFDFTLDGETSSGDIRVNFDATIDNNSIYAKVGKGTHEVKIQTSSGSVKITKAKQ